MSLRLFKLIYIIYAQSHLRKFYVPNCLSKQAGRKAGGHVGRQVGRQEGRKAGRQDGRRPRRQAGRQTDRQAGRRDAFRPCKSMF